MMTTIDRTKHAMSCDPLRRHCRANGIAAGSRQTKTKDGAQTAYNYNDANRLLTALTGQSTASYTWDTRGNLTAEDVDGNATTYGYSLTEDDKLTEANGAPAFRYDADGRKFKLGDGETLQQYDGDRVLRETPGEFGWGDTRTHVYGLQLLRTYVQPPMMEPPQHLFYHFDGQGSTRALTDENGNVAATYVYDAYGNVVASTGNATTAYRYVGAERYREAGYGLLWVGSRHYDPEVGRWTTEDRWLGDAARTQSVNRYVYCEGDPVNQIDASGACPLALWPALAWLCGFAAAACGAYLLICQPHWPPSWWPWSSGLTVPIPGGVGGTLSDANKQLNDLPGFNGKLDPGPPDPPPRR